VQAKSLWLVQAYGAPALLVGVLQNKKDPEIWNLQALSLKFIQRSLPAVKLLKHSHMRAYALNIMKCGAQW